MSENQLPRLPLRFLRWFCKDELIDEIEGDLSEAYHQRRIQNSAKAKISFYKEVLLSFNKRNIGMMEKYKETSLGLSWSMLAQYGKILVRTIRKSKVYSSISIVSLTLSLTCAGLIYLYLNKELTYDQVYDDADNIYRISHLSNNSGRSYAFAPVGLVPHLIEMMEAVEDGTRLFKYRRAIPMTLTATKQSFNEARVGWVDPGFFDLFNLKILYGSAEDLKRPYTIMLNESTSQKYFAGKNPIGQTITFNGEYEATLEVIGVFEDFPSNTSFQLDLLSNIETCYKTMWAGGWMTDWQNMFTSAYVKIKPGKSEEVLKVAQEAVSNNYAPDRPKLWETSLQKLTNLHLSEPKDIGEWSSHNDIETIVLFSAIGLIILSLGCFNFINMVTAQAGQRAKEVGVRKVLGSNKKHIAQQTLFETVSFVLISGMLSWGLMYALLPRLGALTSHSYYLNDLANVYFVIGFILSLIIIALLAGAYPALHISRINSLHLMKKNHTAVGGAKVRNTLVTAQFTITSGLVICTLMVFLQMKYIQNRDLGFDDSTIVTMPIHNDEAVIPKINAFRNELLSVSGIDNVTAASHEMLSDYTYITNFIIQGFEEQFKWERYTVEQDYLKAFDLEVIAGRGFDRSIPTDSNAFVLNESAVSALNLTPQQALNLTITDQGLNYTGKIIGVVKDFHFRSLHHDIQPFVMYVNWDRLDYISVNLSSNDFARNIEHLEEKWYQTFGEKAPFFYQFLDQQTSDLYLKEDNESLLFSSFSLLSVILGVLGLFGSALFITE
ncbi:MAG: ABC transporter permease, partial [Bacteroidota bacterium]